MNENTLPLLAVTGTEKRVCEDIAARQQLGLVKYGVSVEESPLPLVEWLQHAYLETLDKAVYLKRAIDEGAEAFELLARLDGMRGMYFQEWLLGKWAKDSKRLQHVSVKELVIAYDEHLRNERERLALAPSP